MKKIIKYIGIGFIIVFSSVIILGNIGKMVMGEKNKGTYQSLESMIAEVNRYLPHKGFDSFDFFIMNRVLIEGDTIVWESVLDTTFFYPTHESTLPESLNGGVLASGNRSFDIDLDTILSNEFLRKSHQLDLLYYHLFARPYNPNRLYEIIMDQMFSQTWRVNSPFSDRKCEYTMTYEEMKSMEDYCHNYSDDALRDFMFEYLKRQNRLLKVASSKADIKMQMVDDGSTLLVYCTFDKSYSEGGNKPIANIKPNQQEMLDALQDDAHSLPFFFGMKEICERANRRLLFRYTDWDKTDSIDFIIY